ncbi:hypothetical protein RRF57_002530 [Xylaria bambusicola]|uniref:Uncharacterized protein n=1 Tax=Xylaria bambusicola TaxID=326684 RepID=A0AAN7U742_9PEZI
MRQESSLARDPSLGGLATRVVVWGMAFSEVPVPLRELVVVASASGRCSAAGSGGGAGSTAIAARFADNITVNTLSSYIVFVS